MNAFVQGAEAIVGTETWLSRQVLVKRRLEKAYRHPTLDARLRAERTRDEANLMIQARRAGVPVPVVYDVDRQGATIVMELIDGDVLRTVLEADDEATALQRLHSLGRIVARLHEAGLTHGDLTTSNVMVPRAGGLMLIDFGLGRFSPEAEPRGVDLHLVEEALEATDSRCDALMAAFLDGYDAAGRDDALRSLEDIRQRGRYRDAT